MGAKEGFKPGPLQFDMGSFFWWELKMDGQEFLANVIYDDDDDDDIFINTRL